jgi:leucyl aminopeptidase
MLTSTQPDFKGDKRRVMRGDLVGLDSLDADALAVFVWADVRPLAGVAGHLDWRLCGALSRALLRRDFQGQAGEAMLVPYQGRMKVRRLFVFGLGPQEQARTQDLKAACRSAYETMRRAGVQRVVFSAPAKKRAPEVEAAFVKAAQEELGTILESILVEAVE